MYIQHSLKAFHGFLTFFTLLALEVSSFESLAESLSLVLAARAPMYNRWQKMNGKPG